MSEKTQEYKGFTIEVEQDPDPVSPLEWLDVNIAIFTRGRFQNLVSGHGKAIHTPDDWDWFRRNTPCISQPLYAYVHGGVILGTTPVLGVHWQWDTALIGVLFLTKEEAIKRQCYPDNWVDEDEVKALLESMFEPLNAYLNGDIWMISASRNGEVFDSCGDFYASQIDESIRDMKAMIDATLRAEAEERAEFDLPFPGPPLLRGAE